MKFLNFLSNSITNSTPYQFNKRIMYYLYTAFYEIFGLKALSEIQGTYLYNANTAYIIKGCIFKTLTTTTASISDGLVYYNGEVYRVSASTITITAGQTLSNIYIVFYKFIDPSVTQNVQGITYDNYAIFSSISNPTPPANTTLITSLINVKVVGNIIYNTETTTDDTTITVNFNTANELITINTVAGSSQNRTLTIVDNENIGSATDGYMTKYLAINNIGGMRGMLLSSIFINNRQNAVTGLVNIIPFLNNQTKVFKLERFNYNNAKTYLLTEIKSDQEVLFVPTISIAGNTYSLTLNTEYKNVLYDIQLSSNPNPPTTTISIGLDNNLINYEPNIIYTIIVQRGETGALNYIFGSQFYVQTLISNEYEFDIIVIKPLISQLNNDTRLSVIVYKSRA